MQGRIKNLLFIIIFVILSSALFFTFSRSVIVIGYFSISGWLIYLWRVKEFRKRIILIGILLFIVYCLLFIVYWPYISARFDLAAIGDGQALNLRQFYNQSAIDFIKTSPLFGAGLGNFVPVLAEMYNKLQPWIFQPVHNIYLLIASETGLPSLLAFLAFLFLIIKNVLSWQKQENPFVSCFLFLVFFLLIIGFFDHFLWDLQQGQILLWLMLGLLSAHSLMNRT